MVNGTWATSPKEMKTGSWKIEYQSGSEVCERVNLTAVTCKDGFEETRGQCVISEKSSLLQKIAGGIIGLLLVVAVGGVLNYFRKDSKRFRKMIMSFILNEVNVIVSLSFEIWDFAGGLILSLMDVSQSEHLSSML